jgi:hypothetical protein
MSGNLEHEDCDGRSEDENHDESLQSDVVM